MKLVWIWEQGNSKSGVKHKDSNLTGRIENDTGAILKGVTCKSKWGYCATDRGRYVSNIHSES